MREPLYNSGRLWRIKYTQDGQEAAKNNNHQTNDRWRIRIQYRSGTYVWSSYDGMVFRRIEVENYVTDQGAIIVDREWADVYAHIWCTFSK